MTAYGPLLNGDALIGLHCPACHVPFTIRDWLAQVPIGPGGDPAARAAARMDAVFRPVTVAVHWSCHTGHNNPPADRVANVSNARNWWQI
jgi:hypothetical protein